jgi:hypothetical protein
VNHVVHIPAARTHEARQKPVDRIAMTIEQLAHRTGVVQGTRCHQHFVGGICQPHGIALEGEQLAFVPADHFLTERVKLAPAAKQR